MNNRKTAQHMLGFKNKEKKTNKIANNSCNTFSAI